MNYFLKINYIIFLALILFLCSCEKFEPPNQDKVIAHENSLLIDCSDLILRIIKNSKNNTPTYVSRSLG
jgi:hypothetical protein